MYVVALTGGVGCGKSTVSKLFQEKGINIIDMDEIAREVVEPGEEALEKIKMHFGHNVLNQDGSLNRKMLREHIFHDTEAKQWLENLLHPLIRTTVDERIKAASSPYCMVVIPLLFETGAGKYTFIDRVCVVDTDEASQIERAITRDGISAALAKKMISTQVSREARLSGADDIIKNTEGLDKLKAQVDKLHQQYLDFSKLKT